MKNSLRSYSYLIKPTIYKVISRIFLGVTFSLLWNHFINKNQIYIMGERPFFLVGVILLAMAWFNYLKLDGISITMVRKDNKRKDVSKYQSRKLIDILEEEVISYELEKEDEILSAIIANVLTGICFLIPSIIIMYL